jgi:hypothetical protein
MQHDKITAKLAANQAASRRWHSRLVRATNALSRLAKQRQRLEASLVRPKPANAPAAKSVPAPAPLTVPVQPTDAMAAAVAVAQDLGIPAFLDRGRKAQAAVDKVIAESKPQLVDQLKAKRAAKVAADKTKMPLSGRAALDAIRKPAKVKAR